MRYRAMHEDDIAAIFEVRTSTRENRVTMEELANVGVTPESTLQGMQTSFQGWV